jgi:predicted acyltransferase
MATAAPAAPRRLVSLDQFRGYTVAGMFVVNYLGSFALTPAILKHHNSYCSYADTIMPLFLFAVGFAFRLTFGRRAHQQGLRAAYGRVARRLGGLIVLSLFLYTFGGLPPTWHPLSELFKRQWFQTLMHIAVTSLWILPVIRAGALVRALFMVASAGLHVALSAWFNFTWVNTPPQGIDGGPLGFLTWTIPAIVGTFACDAMRQGTERRRLWTMLAGAAALMLLGYVLSCPTRLYDVSAEEQSPTAPKPAESPVVPPLGGIAERSLASLLAELPFVPPPAPQARPWNYWMMSQRSGTISYLTFAAGFALAVFVLFHLACERLGWQLGVFRTLGTNALAAYILHGFLEELVKPRIGRDAEWWYVAAGFAVCFGGTYLVVRLMERRGLFLRL